MVKGAVDAGHRGAADSDGDVAFSEGWAGVACRAGAGDADRWFGDGHLVWPLWPVVAMVLEEPEDAVVGAVGRARADLAEELAHGSALPQGAASDRKSVV